MGEGVTAGLLAKVAFACFTGDTVADGLLGGAGDVIERTFDAVLRRAPGEVRAAIRAAEKGIRECDSLVRLDGGVQAGVRKTAADILRCHPLRAAEIVGCDYRPGEIAGLLLARGEGLAALHQRHPREAEALREVLTLLSGHALVQAPNLARVEAEFRREVLSRLTDLVEDVRSRRTGAAVLADALLRPVTVAPDYDPRIALLSARLLDPEHALAPLTGRDAILDELEQWCATGMLLGIQLFVGRGGIGKTRLGIELCRRLAPLRRDRPQQWRCGFLGHQEPVLPSGTWDVLVEEERPLLIVVDYAERRRQSLARLFEALERRQHCRPDSVTRVLLLARNTGDWWDDLRQGSDSYLRTALNNFRITRPDAVGVPRLEPQERDRVFQASLERFATALQVPPPALRTPDFTPPSRPGQDDPFGAALFVQMAALVAVEATRAGSSAIDLTDADALLQYVLDRETGLWKEALGDDRPQLGAAIVQAAALATLVGGAETRAAMGELLDRTPLLGGQPRAVIDRLADLLHTHLSDPLYVNPLTPDTLGEDLVNAELVRDASLIDVVFGGETSDDRVETALTVLNRLAARRPAAVRWLDRVAERHMDRIAVPALRVAVEQPAPIVDVYLRHLDRLSLERLMHAHDALPEKTTALRDLAYTVTDHLVTAFRGQGTASPALAATLNNLSNSLSDLGHREAALAAIEEAVAIRRELAAARPDAFRPYLAVSLNTLSTHLSALGRREAALAAVEEAVAVYRELAAAQPDAFRSDLALSLNNLSNCLSDLGHREAALAAIEEAVAIRRELAAARPDAFRPDLAGSLNNLSNRLSALGRREAALAAVEEAVVIRRELAAARPDAFRPDLAGSLNNLSTCLSALGRREAALAAIEEAVAVYRELAAARPEAFRPYLALSLDNLSTCLSALGHREAALAAIEEAVAIYRELAAARPDAFRPDLAGSLNNLSTHLSALGHREAALAAIEEAVAVYRELAAARPDAFRPDLALSLNNLSNHLSALGHREAALAAVEEAVAVYRELAAARPDAFRPDLARSLNNLSNRLSDLGHREAALAAIEEAVAVYRELAAARPDAFRPDLALSLNNLSNHLSALGHREAALAAVEEAVAVYRELAAARPDAFRPDLALSLNNLSTCLSELGHREAALAAVEEAVAIWRELAAARPDAFHPDLARSLSVRRDCRRALGQHDAALSDADEALRLLFPHFQAVPAAFGGLLIRLVADYLESAEEAGRTPDGDLLHPIVNALVEHGFLERPD
ncbi:tetratricopeptide repeat protein [Rhodocista pekingensis]|uniref:Tetratricopeptide repeat protein n=1 Tax=Rhodocista pekingensis TaxID=201185 RepID=A0ABW2KZ23_9PROT